MINFKPFLVIYCILKENKTHYKVSHCLPVDPNPSPPPIAAYLPVCHVVELNFFQIFLPYSFRLIGPQTKHSQIQPWWVKIGLNQKYFQYYWTSTGQCMHYRLEWCIIMFCNLCVTDCSYSVTGLFKPHKMAWLWACDVQHVQANKATWSHAVCC